MISHTDGSHSPAVTVSKWRGSPCGGRQSGECEVTRWQGRARVRIRSYVGGGMHGWAVAASRCCIRAYACRGEVDVK